MLLAIDTSTRHAGVALWNDGSPVMSTSWYSMRNHTEELMPTIQHILGRTDTRLEQLDAIAVALGPGGFSALRVGISAAKGLALPLKLPLVGVGTLEAEAYPYASTGLPICALLDSRRGEVATATFQKSRGRWCKLREGGILPLDQLIESISRRTLFCGEGVRVYAERLGRALGRKGVVMGFHNPASRLGALCALAEERHKRGYRDGFEPIQPLYLRPPSITLPKEPKRVAK